MKKRILIGIFVFIAWFAPLSRPVFAQQTADEIRQLLQKPQPRIEIPGVKFTETKDLKIEESPTGDQYIQIPFLGQYIAAAYRYFVIVAGVLAVVIILVAGIHWMWPGRILTGGEQDASQTINNAKSQIVGAITGLIIAVSSYVLLYTINPNLVEFKNLRILFIKRAELVIDETSHANYDEFIPGDVRKPNWTAETFDCAKKDEYTPMGVMPKSRVKKFTCPTGVIGDFTVIQEMGPAVCRVGEILAAKGYGIAITSTYRPFDKQVELWCDRGAKEYPDPKKRNSYFAVPGFSNHGHGIAIDAHLTKNGQRLYSGITGKTQCDVDPELIKILSQAFYDASPEFNRLTSEIWHFEYGSGKKSSVNRSTDLPASCT